MSQPLRWFPFSEAAVKIAMSDARLQIGFLLVVGGSVSASCLANCSSNAGRAI